MNYAELIIEGFKKEKEFYIAFIINVFLLVYLLVRFKYTGDNWFFNIVIIATFIASTGLTYHIVNDTKQIFTKRKRQKREKEIISKEYDIFWYCSEDTMKTLFKHFVKNNENVIKFDMNGGDRISQHDQNLENEFKGIGILRAYNLNGHRIWEFEPEFLKWVKKNKL